MAQREIAGNDRPGGAGRDRPNEYRRSRLTGRPPSWPRLGCATRLLDADAVGELGSLGIPQIRARQAEGGVTQANRELPRAALELGTIVVRTKKEAPQRRALLS